jgi:hypothetical protein
VIDEALKEFLDQIHIKITDAVAHEFAIEHQTGAAGNVQHHASQGLIQGYVSVTVAAQSFLVAHCLIKRLTQRDADVFHGVMRIDVQIALGQNIQIQQTMPGNLVEHVIEKRQSGIKLGVAAAVKRQFNCDLSFHGVA